MKRVGLVVCGLLVVTHVLTMTAAAQAPKPKEVHRSVTEVLDHTVLNMEHEFVPAAEAMPEDKFGFAPTNGEFKGVRTFAQQIKHVAESNYYFFGGSKYSEADVKTLTDSIEKLTTKADIVKALKDSFTQAHAFVDTITPENAFVMTAHGTRAGMAAFGIAHVMDHYGQLVVYLRMNGIVPPASRKKM